MHVLFLKEDFVSVSVEVCKAYLYLFASSPLQLVTTDGAVVFSCHFKMETTALLQTFVLSLCSLPHHSQVYIHQNCFLFYSLSLCLFLSFTFLLFLFQDIQRHTSRFFYQSACCETEFKKRPSFDL